jgi:hypothetical protein
MLKSTLNHQPVYLIAPSPWFDAGKVEPATTLAAPLISMARALDPWPPVAAVPAISMPSGADAATAPMALPKPTVGTPLSNPASTGLAVRTGVRMAMPVEAVEAERVDAIDVPNRYTPAFADAFCERIVDGETLHSICLADGKPDRFTVRRWMRANPDFEQKYNAARRQRADARADRMDAISQAVSSGEIHPEVAKVMLQNERWQASKENVRRYGDKTEIDVTARTTETPRECPSVDWQSFDIECHGEPEAVSRGGNQ